MKKLIAKSAKRLSRPAALFCSNRNCANPSQVILTLANLSHENLCLSCFTREFPELARMVREPDGTNHA
jgi:hypothetical protein